MAGRTVCPPFYGFAAVLDSHHLCPLSIVVQASEEINMCQLMGDEYE
jgi:hypothetical protein